MKNNQQQFTSISSDNNLFDFDNMRRSVMKSHGKTEKDFTEAMRQHFAQQHQSLSDVELAGLVANYVNTPSNFDKFCLSMDILGLKIAIGINALPSYPEEWNLHVKQTGMDTRTAHTLMGEDLFFLGQVISLTESDLLRLPKFGRAALQELIATLNKYGLKLGTNTDTWKKPAKISYPEIWDKPIEKFFPDPHVSRALLNGRIAYIGQLIQKTEVGLLAVPGIGGNRGTCISKIKSCLAAVGLKLETDTPGWMPPTV